MTENIPPGSADKAVVAAVTSEPTARGLPYYEKLRRDLRDTLQKKRILDKNMAALEDSIYRAETSYLEETSPAGNIIKGFDNYIKSSAHSLASSATATATTPAAGGTISGSAAGGSGPATARSRKIVINEMDRVFSRSSRGAYGGIGGRDSETPSSATTTPGHTGLGETGGFGGKGQNGGGSGPQSVKGDNNKKKKKGSVTAAAAAASAGAEESETDGKPNKRARISYGPRE